VLPIVEKHFKALRHSAALLGPGSEVLGYDTEISRDHHWGPRVLLFLSESDYPQLQSQISQALSQELPTQFMGYSTNFSEPESNGVRHAVAVDHGPVNHLAEIFTIRSFFGGCLKFDPYREPSAADWLAFPQQRLLELTRGEVFHDGLEELNPIRQKLGFYPQDVWYYMLASHWGRLSEQEAFHGRCGDAGDELGSRIVAARIVRDVMSLCFLMEGKYAPYSKWFGTAFSELECASKLTPLLTGVFLEERWKAREQALAKIYEVVAEMHNALGITEPLPTKVTHYYGRPYLVIRADKFAEAIRSRISDDEVRTFKPDLGSVDQFVDSPVVLEDPGMTQRLKALFES
jgi:hypothetical protein